jgi:hypothetical protein
VLPGPIVNNGEPVVELVEVPQVTVIPLTFIEISLLKLLIKTLTLLAAVELTSE